MPRTISGRTKRYRWRTKEINELQRLDKQILKEAKMWRENVVMAGIDSKNVDDMFAQVWIIECIKRPKYPTKSLSSYQMQLKNGGWN